MREYRVYILASRRNGTLYIGVTSNLLRRMAEHREGRLPGFTREYRVHRLVHVEPFDDVRLALQRERNLKRWLRAWKVALIETANPDWIDLYPALLGAPDDGSSGQARG